MRTRKSRRSESFWPSIVVRKWLNIKPKVHEFSEDEVETESDDDDGFSPLTSKSLVVQDARISGGGGGSGRLFFETEERESTDNSSEASGTETRASMARLRRRRSETLRLNYITSKDLRVMIGTWNVAGRTPVEDLELDEWLDTQEPADMYVLGFQEVVPLNAGNVLGAEDSRPIQKWEAIIRRSLNRSSQTKTVYKSYSAPLSPVTSPTASRAGEKPSQRSKNISIIHGGVDLDWPEYSLDTPRRVLVPGKELRRVLSSSARIGLDWPHGSAGGAGMKRVCQSSGNLGMLWSEQQAAADVLSSLNDISDRSSEEEEEEEEEEKPSKSSDRYVRVVSKQMVGVYISVWVCRRLRRHVNNLKVSPVGVGIMGYMGNKGSVSVSMTVFQTRLCFVCSHLTSGHKDGDQQRRNSDVFDILQRTRFCSVDADHHQSQTIPSHDRIFWFGDLNYRLNLPDAEVRALVARKSWDELMNYDQLSNELRSGRIFDGWKEGSVNFPPTYKYERNSNRYAGEVAREGEKKRSPAWCDRILWLGKGIRQESYWRSELDLSDHRPVSSVLLVEVEVFDQRKLERVLNFAGAGFLAEND